MRKRLFVLILLCSTNAIPASYKWVDENNRTHYSEQPPANKKAKILPSSSSASVAAASSVPSVPKTIAERAAELDKAKLAKKDVADKAAQKQAYDDALKANCDAAKKNLASLQDGVRLVEIDANGERSYLNDEQRQQKIAKAQQDIQANCK
jgi:hypothetical protein